MYTYQDLLETGSTDEERMQFVRLVIADHKKSELYNTALLAIDYDKKKNRTILNYQKLLYTVSGKSVPDNFSANYKMCSNFFDYFITQENSYLLSNGITWQNDETADKVGEIFEEKVQEIGKRSLIEGEAFGFWNYDHIDVFGISEFAPLYDEETGALMAGVRFWQISSDKPLRATLYEADGYTEYIWRSDKAYVLQPKRNYIVHYQITPADGKEITGGENYPSFPIVPLWCSDKKQSEIVGLRENIDAYDLIKSGFANDLDDTSQIYWILKNAGGMDEKDLVEFLNRLHRTHAASLIDDVDVEAHTINVPYDAREALLTRLRTDLFEMAMAFDPQKLASGGSVVTSAIKAAFMSLDEKTDEYERCVIKFVNGILKVAGINDRPSFTRSRLINETEQISNLIQAAQYLPSDYVTTKIAGLLGDGAIADKLIRELDKENSERMYTNTGLTDEEKQKIAEDFKKNANGGSGQHISDGSDTGDLKNAS